MIAADYYGTLFQQTFDTAQKRTDITPFTMPALPDIRAAQVELYVPKHGDRVVPVKDYADYLDLKSRPFHTAIDLVTTASVKELAHRAVGAYQAFAYGATLRYGRGAGVAYRLKFNFVVNESPSVADPMCVIPGWVSYRMQFISCPQEWLAYVLPVKK